MIGAIENARVRVGPVTFRHLAVLDRVVEQEDVRRDTGVDQLRLFERDGPQPSIKPPAAAQPPDLPQPRADALDLGLALVKCRFARVH